MATTPRITHVVEFSCKHVRTFDAPSPKVGEKLWCPQCRIEVVVTRAPAEFRIRCENCTHSKPFGAAKLNAEIGAAKHRMRYPTHVVRIYDGLKIVKTFRDRDQTVIPMSSPSDQQIPF